MKLATQKTWQEFVQAIRNGETSTKEITISLAKQWIEEFHQDKLKLYSETHRNLATLISNHFILITDKVNESYLIVNHVWDGCINDDDTNGTIDLLNDFNMCFCEGSLILDIDKENPSLIVYDNQYPSVGIYGFNTIENSLIHNPSIFNSIIAESFIPKGFSLRLSEIMNSDLDNNNHDKKFNNKILKGYFKWPDSKGAIKEK